jgi:hypothetical protein
MGMPITCLASNNNSNTVTFSNYQSEADQIVAMRLDQLRAGQEQDLMQQAGHAVALPIGACSAFVAVSAQGSVRSVSLVGCPDDSLASMFVSAIETAVLPATGSAMNLNLSVNVTRAMPSVSDNHGRVLISQSGSPIKDLGNVSAMSRQDKMAVLFANAEYAIAECEPIAPDQAARYSDAVRAKEARMGTSPELLSQSAAYLQAYGYLVDHDQFVSDAERHQRCENLPRGLF